MKGKECTNHVSQLKLKRETGASESEKSERDRPINHVSQWKLKWEKKLKWKQKSEKDRVKNVPNMFHSES